ncbi:MAG TPA: redoxin domain-containing protein [Polyangiaceae bacterium]|nr:redoxin domain-containing protein [Polyangiaceae bacterium]
MPSPHRPPALGRRRALAALGALASPAGLAALASPAALAGCGDDGPAPNEPGAPAPQWSLVDFQPQSEGFGQSYGLDRFRGKVLLVTLYAGWCNTCVGHALKMAEVEKQLAAEGLDLRVVSINAETADSTVDQQRLIDVAHYPLFQDTPAVRAWETLRGTRGDLFVYGPDGVLRAYYPVPGPVQVDPYVPEGLANLRQALFDAR